MTPPGTRWIWWTALGALCVCLPPQLPLAAEASDDAADVEAWFESDAEEGAAEVNEGALEFLNPVSARDALHSHNRYALTAQSLTDGWVDLLQCYTNLDAVPDAQVVYSFQHMRDLRIDELSGIAKGWVEGASVQLSGVQSGARLCVTARVRVLHANSDGSYSLINGPFHRRFLDGYYPMRVTLDVQFAPSLLRYVGTDPPAQSGFEVVPRRGGVQVDAWFAGKLMTEVRLAPVAVQPK